MQIKNIAALLFAVIAVNFYSVAQKSNDEKHVVTVLRMVGHQLLLNSGDSTSRVLPIEKSDEYYQISFSSDFNFESTILAATINEFMVA